MRLTKTYLRRLIKEEVNLILNEQEDGAANQEEGPGQTKQEAIGQAARKRMVTWGSKLRPQVYRQFLQNVKKAIEDAEASVSWVAKDPEGLYKRIATLTVRASKGKVMPKQALQFENEAGALVDLEKYGYPVTAKMAGASL